MTVSWFKNRDAVEVGGKRQIGKHCHHVCNGDCSEDAVGWRKHRFSGQNDDVDDVGQDAEDADDDTQVSVHTLVPLIEGNQVGKSVVFLVQRGADVRSVIIRPVMLFRDEAVGARHVVMSNDVDVQLGRHFFRNREGRLFPEETEQRCPNFTAPG